MEPGFCNQENTSRWLSKHSLHDRFVSLEFPLFTEVKELNQQRALAIVLISNSSVKSRLKVVRRKGESPFRIRSSVSAGAVSRYWFISVSKTSLWKEYTVQCTVLASCYREFRKCSFFLFLLTDLELCRCIKLYLFFNHWSFACVILRLTLVRNLRKSCSKIVPSNWKYEFRYFVRAFVFAKKGFAGSHVRRNLQESSVDTISLWKRITNYEGVFIFSEVIGIFFPLNNCTYQCLGKNIIFGEYFLELSVEIFKIQWSFPFFGKL